jgi:hypothetical protein
MDYYSILAAGLGGALGGALGALLLKVLGRDAQSAGGQALTLVPALLLATLFSQLGVGEKLRDVVSPPSRMERIVRRHSKALEANPHLKRRLEASSDKSQVGRELSHLGLRRLSMADMDTWHQLRARLAESSGAICAGFWTGRLAEAQLLAELDGLRWVALVGRVLAPRVIARQSPRGEYRDSEVYCGGHGRRTFWACAAWRVQYGSNRWARASTHRSARPAARMELTSAYEDDAHGHGGHAGLVAHAVGEGRLEQAPVHGLLVGHGLTGGDVDDVGSRAAARPWRCAPRRPAWCRPGPSRGRDAHRDRLVLQARRAHRAQHLEREAQATLEAAAVLVGAPVGERREERGQQVAVGHVHLDEVEAGLVGQLVARTKSCLTASMSARSISLGHLRARVE